MMSHNVSGTPRAGSLLPPTLEQIAGVYRSIIERAHSAHAAHVLDSPPAADPSKYPTYDVTPAGVKDFSATAFEIGGRLYVRYSGAPGTTGLPTVWYDVGGLPTICW